MPKIRAWGVARRSTKMLQPERWRIRKVEPRVLQTLNWKLCGFVPVSGCPSDFFWCFSYLSEHIIFIISAVFPSSSLECSCPGQPAAEWKNLQCHAGNIPFYPHCGWFPDRLSSRDFWLNLPCSDFFAKSCDSLKKSAKVSIFSLLKATFRKWIPKIHGTGLTQDRGCSGGQDQSSTLWERNP